MESICQGRDFYSAVCDAFVEDELLVDLSSGVGLSKNWDIGFSSFITVYVILLRLLHMVLHRVLMILHRNMCILLLLPSKDGLLKPRIGDF